MRVSFLFLCLLLDASPASAQQTTYHHQNDHRLTAQPFGTSGRGIYLEFFTHGMYRTVNIQDGVETMKGAYSRFGDVVTFDPGETRQMSCRYSFTRIGELELDNCAFRGVWKPLIGIR